MATVIKAGGPTRSDVSGAFNFEDMSQRAGSYLDTVRQQAAEIIAQAQQEADAIRRQAQDQGRAAALQAAQQVLDQKLSQELTTLIPALRQAAENIETAKAQWLAHWERTAIHLAAAMAERVVRRQLDRTPEIQLTYIREALELAAGRGEIELRLHPDDFAALGPQAQRLADELTRLGTCKVVADAAISRGGCRIDTKFGVIDQQIQAQLARIEEDLA